MKTEYLLSKAINENIQALLKHYGNACEISKTDINHETKIVTTTATANDEKSYMPYATMQTKFIANDLF